MQFEGLSGAVSVSIVAFSIVFGVLLVLTGVIYGMKLFAGSGGEKKNDVVSPKPAAPAPVKVSVPANTDKTKIVAAITAAIVEFTGNANFKIVSVQAEQQAPDYWTSRWKLAGMVAQNANRLHRSWH